MKEENAVSPTKPKVLFIEPFYGGSHKVLIDALVKMVRNYTLVTLKAKKWHWRARCGALMICDKIPEITSEKVLFCSSVINLAELLGLRPDLHALKKVVYFHENQLIYPVQETKNRDVQYAYNQITTCCSADIILFNSNFNKDSFLNNINKILKFLPDNRPKNVKEKIASKSHVLYFPLKFDEDITNRRGPILHIAWPHRWEFDKGPDDFFQVLLKLKQNKHAFRISVLGEQFSQSPNIFAKAAEELKEEIVHFGYLENKEKYVNALCSCHVVVSTAKHEFFGVAMLESTFYGCLPIAPNNLVYPEIYPPECLYSSLEDLYRILENFCKTPILATNIRNKLKMDFDMFSDKVLLPQYLKLLEINM